MLKHLYAAVAFLVKEVTKLPEKSHTNSRNYQETKINITCEIMWCNNVKMIFFALTETTGEKIINIVI